MFTRKRGEIMIEDWINIKNKEDLDNLISIIFKNKEERNFNSIRKLIKKDLQKFQKQNTNIEISQVFNMGSRDKKGMVEKISILRSFLNTKYNEEREKIERKVEKNKYFKNDAYEYIYYLLELDGKDQMDKLKIYKIHYYDRNKADKWYKNIIKKIHPDKFPVEEKEIANAATAKLIALYNRMILNE